MKERWKRFRSLFSVEEGWSRRHKALMYLVLLVLVLVLLICICRPNMCQPAPAPIPDPNLPTRAEVEAELPEMWFVGISFELMRDRISEKFPTTAPRAEFVSGAKYLVLEVKEGSFFVAPGHKLIPWPPA